MHSKGFRNEFLYIFLICCFVLSTALYMEFGMGLEPCLLCMSQRIVYLLVAFISLLGMLHNPKLGGHRKYGLAIVISCLGGVALAVRQLYLQSLPEDLVPACGPGFSYVVDTLPLMDVIVSMLKGSGSCAEIQFSFLGLSIPGWSLVCYIILIIYSTYLWRRQTKVMIIG